MTVAPNIMHDTGTHFNLCITLVLETPTHKGSYLKTLQNQVYNVERTNPNKTALHQDIKTHS